MASQENKSKALKLTPEAPLKLMKSFFQGKKKFENPSQQVVNQLQQQQGKKEEPIKKFDPLEVIKCLSEMKPITILYGKDKRQLQNVPQINSKSELIHEADVTQLLKKHGDLGYQALLVDNYKDSLLNLRKADIILNAYVSNDGKVAQDILLYIKMNLGICFYKIGLLEEAYTCFETCILSIKNRSVSRNKNQSTQSSVVNLSNEYFLNLQQKMQKRKIKAQLFLQCCILLSELGKHEDGLQLGRLAAKKCINQIMDSMSICYNKLQKIANSYQVQRPRSNSKGRSRNQFDLNQTIDRVSQDSLNDAKMILWNDFYSPKTSFQRAIATNNDLQTNNTQQTQSSHQTIKSLQPQLGESDILQDQEQKTYQYCKKLLAILFEIYKKIQDLRKIFLSVKKEKIVNIQSKLLQNTQSRINFTFEKADLSLLFSNIGLNHWIFKTNILGLLQLKPQSFKEISYANEFDQIIEQDSILQFISNLAVSLYCISTETRFIDDQKKKNPLKQNDIAESENWLSRSLEIAYVFLPHEIPLVGQIISVHTKFHGISKQIIPEDQAVDCNYTVVKSLKGGSKSNFFVPVIRKTQYIKTLLVDNDIGAVECFDLEEEQTIQQLTNSQIQSRKSSQSQNNPSQSTPHHKKLQKRISFSRERQYSTIDQSNIHQNTNIINKYKFFSQHHNSKTINHTSNKEQSFATLEKVYKNNQIIKPNTSERKHRNHNHNNNGSQHNHQGISSHNPNNNGPNNLFINNNSIQLENSQKQRPFTINPEQISLNNSRQMSPKIDQNQFIRQNDMINNSKQKQMQNNIRAYHQNILNQQQQQQQQQGGGGGGKQKKIKPLSQNFIEVDQILDDITIEKEKPLDQQFTHKKKNLDIQINNNINFFINSEQIGSNFINDNIISSNLKAGNNQSDINPNNIQINQCGNIPINPQHQQQHNQRQQLQQNQNQLQISNSNKKHQIPNSQVDAPNQKIISSRQQKAQYQNQQILPHQLHHNNNQQQQQAQYTPKTINQFPIELTYKAQTPKYQGVAQKRMNIYKKIRSNSSQTKDIFIQNEFERFKDTIDRK